MSEDQPVEDLPKISLGNAVSRGLRLRCPLCGAGHLFGSAFKMHAECDECRFRFEREAGYFLGSTYINYGVTALLATGTYVVLLFGFEIEKSWILPGLLAFCLNFPLVFFRFARSLWLSLDCFFDRVGAAEAQFRPPAENPKNNSG